MKRIFSNREIVLGVTGSIAAYKACELASRLTEYGAKVTPVLTKSACELVGPATFEAVCGRRAITHMFEPLQNPEVEHIAVALKAHLYLIAPATANFIAKAAHGIADDWLTTTLLATRAPILVAPAMNTNMFEHPATQENIQTLRRRGVHFIGPDAGRLACKTVGPGRLIDPARIVEACVPLVSDRRDLDGVRIVMTSGGTHEPIDPVRYIGNRSSGKMGRALAIEALARGASVTVITGPCDVPLPEGALVIPVESAAQMAEAVVNLAQDADVFIGAAAVADYRVENPSDSKRKKTGRKFELSLVENPDVLGLVGAVKRAKQILVGFAAETDDLLANAAAKLKKKQLDLIVANEVNTDVSGFGKDTSKAALIGSDGVVQELPLLTKEEVAERILDRVAALAAKA
ncbi:MAG: bifunctional phosphopantothenoylcysteine decarboxylase/phosphopantothenate--cysteine ligase CoaBC [Candidatus Hydrogenedentes bacterium]|nr:bifunctional phosphopantothenoylcysteine decarboxylase/phosphopantothenate--cysteine ligase CoaBC [Candidatus Hydrogenedentota bacterium]